MTRMSDREYLEYVARQSRVVHQGTPRLQGPDSLEDKVLQACRAAAKQNGWIFYQGERARISRRDRRSPTRDAGS